MIAPSSTGAPPTNLLITREGAVATIAINRPKALNALDPQTLLELTEAFGRLSHDVRCVILTGSGERAFVAGADIVAMSTMDSSQAGQFAALGHALGDLMERLPVPIIAAVNGYALGGGCELAMACDFIYAADSAVFGQPEATVGVSPGFGGIQRLARRIGVARARELLFSGRPIDAAEALRIGLVNRVVAKSSLLAESQTAAVAIAEKAPLAVAAMKRTLRSGEDQSLSAGLAAERETFAALFATEDQREGMRAFIEKRAPRFQGR